MTTLGYIVGSLSRDSINRRLAQALVAAAPTGCEFVEIPIVGLPQYNPDHDHMYLPAAARLKALIETVDGVVVVTPEYNRTFPGALKNAIDFASRPWGETSWTGKPVALLGTGLNSAGTAVAQSHLRSVLTYCGAQVLGLPETCVPWSEDLFDADGRPSATLSDQLTSFLVATLAHTRRYAA